MIDASELFKMSIIIRSNTEDMLLNYNLSGLHMRTRTTFYHRYLSNRLEVISEERSHGFKERFTNLVSSRERFKGL